LSWQIRYVLKVKVVWGFIEWVGDIPFAFRGLDADCELTSLDEPTEDLEVAAAVVWIADRPKYIGSER
jgi:hypothetical protein